MDQLNVPTKQLEDLLRKATPWPWELSMDGDGKWCIRSTAIARYIADELPEHMNNYDRRLWGLAPVLAAEVLYLRKKVADLQEK